MLKTFSFILFYARLVLKLLVLYHAYGCGKLLYKSLIGCF